jgi:hypothetical protein
MPLHVPDVNTTQTPSLLIENHFIVMHDLTAVAALETIVHILNLNCDHQFGFNIRASPTALPPSLMPTPKQQTIAHFAYVDMIPWPAMRDRLLGWAETMNVVEFTSDMASGMLRIWGVTPWDPMGWEVSDEFVRKWWFLVDEDIVRTSNFWRRQRGERGVLKMRIPDLPSVDTTSVLSDSCQPVTF